LQVTLGSDTRLPGTGSRVLSSQPVRAP
jgi:hypothetical protein